MGNVTASSLPSFPSQFSQPFKFFYTQTYKEKIGAKLMQENIRKLFFNYLQQQNFKVRILFSSIVLISVRMRFKFLWFFYFPTCFRILLLFSFLIYQDLDFIHRGNPSVYRLPVLKFFCKALVFLLFLLIIIPYTRNAIYHFATSLLLG